MADTLARVRMKRLIDMTLDGLYEQASEMGKRMGRRLGQSNAGKAQIRGLEAVAAAATRTSALKNHVKNQTGKESGPEDRHIWSYKENGRALGRDMLELLDGLRGKAESIVKRLEGVTETHREEWTHDAEISLQQGIIHALVCAALYERREGNDDTGQP